MACFRMSEWCELGETLEGTPWDPRDRDWSPGRVHFEFQYIDGVWCINSNRYRVVELFYDAEDIDLPQFVEPVEETTLLSILSQDVVQHHIWPRIVHGSQLQSIQEMARVRRVCKGWKDWVDKNKDWIEEVQSYMENNSLGSC